MTDASLYTIRVSAAVAVPQRTYVVDLIGVNHNATTGTTFDRRVLTHSTSFQEVVWDAPATAHMESLQLKIWASDAPNNVTYIPLQAGNVLATEIEDALSRRLVRLSNPLNMTSPSVDGDSTSDLSQHAYTSAPQTQLAFWVSVIIAFLVIVPIVAMVVWNMTYTTGYVVDRKQRYAAETRSAIAAK
jgi:hypothetical protein